MGITASIGLWYIVLKRCAVKCEMAIVGHEKPRNILFHQLPEKSLFSDIFIPIITPDLNPGDCQRDFSYFRNKSCRNTGKIGELLAIDNIKFFPEQGGYKV